MTNSATTKNPIEEMRTTKPTINTEFPTGSTSGNYNSEGNSLEIESINSSTKIFLCISIILMLEWATVLSATILTIAGSTTAGTKPTETMMTTIAPTISTTTTDSSTGVTLGIFELC